MNCVTCGNTDFTQINNNSMCCTFCGTIHNKTGTTMQSEDQTSTRVELLEKLRNLEVRITEVSKDKKNAADNYNDELKILKAELADVLAQLEDTPYGGSDAG